MPGLLSAPLSAPVKAELRSTIRSFLDSQVQYFVGTQVKIINSPRVGFYLIQFKDGYQCVVLDSTLNLLRI